MADEQAVPGMAQDSNETSNTICGYKLCHLVEAVSSAIGFSGCCACTFPLHFTTPPGQALRSEILLGMSNHYTLASPAARISKGDLLPFRFSPLIMSSWLPVACIHRQHQSWASKATALLNYDLTSCEGRASPMVTFILIET